MRIEERQIEVEQVVPGMYVCRLDRPWTGTPFPLQGFMVESDEHVALLHQHCQRVWIDVELGRAPPDAPLRVLSRSQRDFEALLGSTDYSDTTTLAEEAPIAREVLDDVSRLSTRILDDLRAGHVLLPQDVEAAATPIVKSILRNADALFWVKAMRKHDSYGYSHAINCSALAAAFGRNLGLPEDILVELASGGLLLDVGKTALPIELLAHPGPLDAEQMSRARQHVELSLKILDQGGQQSWLVHEMVRNHHERHDGSGYPGRLEGIQIPLFGRVAAIIDSFDAMTSERPHARAMSHHDALQELYRARSVLYHAELVEQFISCLGVYPTGSLVELSNGELAVVMAQNPARRLRPRIMLLTDPDKRLREHFMPLDLMLMSEDVADSIRIARPLPIGAYGLDPSELYL